MNQQQLQRAAEQIREHLNSVGYDLGPDTVNLIRQVLTVEQKRAGASWMQAQTAEEIADLKRWKAEAIGVMPDFQAIAEELHIPIGKSVSKNILPAIDKIKSCSNTRKNEILRLREIIDEQAEEVERLKGERQWISVKDRLPESNNVFLVVRQYGLGRQEIKCAFFRTDHNCFDDFLENIITHWMPLPEPPKPQTEHE